MKSFTNILNKPSKKLDEENNCSEDQEEMKHDL